MFEEKYRKFNLVLTILAQLWISLFLSQFSQKLELALKKN